MKVDDIGEAERCDLLDHPVGGDLRHSAYHLPDACNDQACAVIHAEGIRPWRPAIGALLDADCAGPLELLGPSPVKEESYVNRALALYSHFTDTPIGPVRP